jgi:L-ribulose-5-phosphate 4-epimerase
VRLEAVRRRLVRLHAELPRNNLVAWTSGNVSARDPDSGLIAIKPSGVRYEDLTAEAMVVLDLDGAVIEGDHKPSSDTAATCTSTVTDPTSTGSCTPIPAMPPPLPRSGARSPST